ncbi:MAG: hypothetical protein H5U40_03985 [Polyangiaceae bacterium]|nr:hypothetical protein [Polyangiaceae bacterium]
MSHERVHDEWMKAMKARRPSPAFEVMARTGILEVTSPELATLAEQLPSVWAASLDALDACEAGPVVRHAALFHRVAEYRSTEGVIADDTVRARESAAILDRFFRDYRYSTEERETAAHLLRHLPFDYNSSWSDPDVRRFVRRIGLEHLEALFELSRVTSGDDQLPELRARIDALREGLVLSPKELAITGSDLMKALGAGPGPHLGEILRTLVERVTDDPSLNQPETLLALGRELEPEARANAPKRGKKPLE